MAIQITLPANLEERLRADLGDLAAAGKEAMLVELYRQAKITHHELSQALGLSRFETDAVLKRHDVTEDLPMLEEHLADLDALRKLTP
jgi:predicted outer membrane protein